MRLNRSFTDPFEFRNTRGAIGIVDAEHEGGVRMGLFVEATGYEDPALEGCLDEVLALMHYASVDLPLSVIEQAEGLEALAELGLAR